MTVAGPSVSIVVPTYRRPGALGDCLAALAALTRPPGRLEVVVVDDGGGLPLDEVVAPYREALSLSLLRQPRSGPAAARNLGAREAGGEILAFVDDDCRPEPSWLAVLVERLSGEARCAVGGRTVTGGGSRYAAVSQLVADIVYSYYDADPEDGRFLASNNLALRAADFRALGGFDERFRCAEDRDLCDRLRASGHRLVFLPGAVVRHRPALDLGGFCRQHFAYGRGAYLYQRERARRGSGRLAEDLPFQLRLPRLAASAMARSEHRVATAALLCVWQAANAAGFAAAGAQALVHGAGSRGSVAEAHRLGRRRRSH